MTRKQKGTVDKQGHKIVDDFSSAATFFVIVAHPIVAVRLWQFRSADLAAAEPCSGL